MKDVRSFSGGPTAWQAAGLKTVATPNDPSDANYINFLFHTHQRNDGNDAAACTYIAWEIGLVDQLSEQ